MLISIMGCSKYTDSTTELYSRANMIVVGKQAFVFIHSVKSLDVKAFTDKVVGLSKMLIVDAVIAYDCPRIVETFLLVVSNALCVLGIDHNLLPPSILRKYSLVVNDAPNIYIDDPSVEDHSIFDVEIRLRIPLRISGIFSVFQTRSLNE